MSSFSQLSAAQLRRAANLKERIAKLENQLESMLGASTSAGAKSGAPVKKRRTMSAAARAKIAAAARARWARVRAEKKK